MTKYGQKPHESVCLNSAAKSSSVEIPEAGSEKYKATSFQARFSLPSGFKWRKNPSKSSQFAFFSVDPFLL